MILLVDECYFFIKIYIKKSITINIVFFFSIGIVRHYFLLMVTTII